MKELQIDTIGKAFEELTMEEMVMSQGGGQDIEVYSTITMPISTLLITTATFLTAYNDCF